MKRRHHIAIGVAAALSVVGVGGAIAATQLTPKQESQAVLNDAAKQLGVEPNELSNALKQALKNRVDAAVQDGRLTDEQGRRMKERIDAGAAPLLGLGPRGFGHRHHRPGHLFHPGIEAAADYLGMTQAQLANALRGGKTLAQVARDNNKTVEGLVDALVADAKKRFGTNEVPADLREAITDIVNGRHRRPPHFDRDRPMRGAVFTPTIF
jgi:hypothetical protein